MSKITRQTLQPFGSTGPTDDFEQFGSTEEGSPNFTKTIATLQSLSAWLTGWRAALVTAKAPVLQDMNAVCYVFSYMIGYLLQQGIAEWDSGTTYYISSIVMNGVTGEMYGSNIDGNVGNALPSRVTDSNWTYIGLLPSLARLSAYRRPNLTAVSSTTCSIEVGLNGQSAANGSILFPDGQFIPDGAAGHIILDVTRVASLGASPQSGLRTGTVANNTWYAVYAVKANSSSNFVLVADTVLPLVANYATLNSNFGTNGWVYLGLIRNGDSGGTAAGILPFFQCGNKTYFTNTGSGESVGGYSAAGILVATTASAATLTYAYTAGVSGRVTPANIVDVTWSVSNGNIASAISVRDSGGAIVFATWIGGSNATGMRLEAPVQLGVELANAASTAIAWDIFLSGFTDIALGVGSNPLI